VDTSTESFVIYCGANIRGLGDNFNLDVVGELLKWNAHESFVVVMTTEDDHRFDDYTIDKVSPITGDSLEMTPYPIVRLPKTSERFAPLLLAAANDVLIDNLGEVVRAKAATIERACSELENMVATMRRERRWTTEKCVHTQEFKRELDNRFNSIREDIVIGRYNAYMPSNLAIMFNLLYMTLRGDINFQDASVLGKKAGIHAFTDYMSGRFEGHRLTVIYQDFIDYARGGFGRHVRVMDPAVAEDLDREKANTINGLCEGYAYHEREAAFNAYSEFAAKGHTGLIIRILPATPTKINSGKTGIVIVTEGRDELKKDIDTILSENGISISPGNTLIETDKNTKLCIVRYIVNRPYAGVMRKMISEKLTALGATPAGTLAGKTVAGLQKRTEQFQLHEVTAVVEGYRVLSAGKSVAEVTLFDWPQGVDTTKLGNPVPNGSSSIIVVTGAKTPVVSQAVDRSLSAHDFSSIETLSFRYDEEREGIEPATISRIVVSHTLDDVRGAGVDEEIRRRLTPPEGAKSGSATAGAANAQGQLMRLLQGI